MQQAKLYDGKVVDIVGHVTVNGKVYFIVKLQHAKMIDEKIISMVLYPIHYFQGYKKEGFENQ